MSRHDKIRYRDKLCPVCETQFTPRTGRQVYCSPECQHGRSTCHGCGKRFVKTKNTTGLYCSPECWYKAPGKKEIVPRPCEECQNEFQPSDSTKRFCSRTCAMESRRKKRKRQNCERCDKPLSGALKSTVRFCSHACAMARPHHENWGRVLPNGSKRRTHFGYVQIKVDGKWMLEHRHVMQEKLGRILLRTEHVHHVDGNKANNAPENLEMWKKRHPHGVRNADYHCPGCRCHMATPRTVRIVRR
jgi:hypothetical protein